MSAATGGVRWVLRLEGLVIFFLAIYLYRETGADWRFFLLLFLVPDVSFVAYLAGATVGAAAYNVMHTYGAAVLCVAAGYVLAMDWVQAVGLIWVAHVGFDRALGYGLKYRAGFAHTHLGRIGRR
jgi:uncharacterized membrane protein